MKIASRVLLAFVFALTLQVLGAAQTPTPTPPSDKSVVKPFPPAKAIRFTELQKDLELAKAQFEAAQARFATAQTQVSLELYKVADELNLTKAEKETCVYSQVSQGNNTWIFTCPPPKEKSDSDKATSKPGS